jgi:molybdopterin synthase sulfur carrier subunit
MKVRILYFASLCERLGCREEIRELPAGIATWGALRAWLAADGRRALDDTPGLRGAVNQRLARGDTPLAEGDEVAFFPPVSGG